jgi:hypothetical protein
MIAKIAFTTCVIVLAISQMNIQAWAGGPGDTPPSCLVPNPPGGATAVRGTVSVGVQNAATTANSDVDFTLRLERGGALAFFRASVNMQVFATSNENILCTLLRDSTSQGAIDLRSAILSTFGFSPNAAFYLVDKSLSKAEIQGTVNQWLCNNTYTPPTPLSAPPTNCQAPARAASMADVLIYVK